ncbi:hypothetical protein L7D45_22275 [Brucella pseudogrignonensis]|uniref:hypothetical protein n=1 Tax=Brucella pseudogrignonensis TaxID=419475 RepID=UPI00190A7663|nr:hypothetical protein [Brucella pseudogrignonensis]MBK0024504.1 hypothetical protein [Ochrobactrum sp. S45]MBK0046490.1 hypothetical protein [Ochrobactrum sp. S46]UKK95404.1 hypothetical protein L7D45_22275 [Brucella pseudogrignonensis]
MPFRDDAYKGVFKPEELATVQQAYNLCCEILNRDPNTHPNRDILAHYVLRAFEDSDGDPELAAKRAAEIARMLE